MYGNTKANHKTEKTQKPNIPAKAMRKRKNRQSLEPAKGKK